MVKSAFGKAEGNVLVEIYDEHFIAGIAGLNESFRGGNHIVTLGTHAATAVDNQTYGDGNIGVAEMLDVLGDAVLENLEIIFVEAGDGNTFVIFRRGVKDHESDRHFNFRG